VLIADEGLKPKGLEKAKRRGGMDGGNWGAAKPRGRGTGTAVRLIADEATKD